MRKLYAILGIFLFVFSFNLFAEDDELIGSGKIKGVENMTIEIPKGITTIGLDSERAPVEIRSINFHKGGLSIGRISDNFMCGGKAKTIWIDIPAGTEKVLINCKGEKYKDVLYVYGK